MPTSPRVLSLSLHCTISNEQQISPLLSHSAALSSPSCENNPVKMLLLNQSWPFSAQTLQWLPPASPPPVFLPLLALGLLCALISYPSPVDAPPATRTSWLFPQHDKDPTSRPLNWLVTWTSLLPDTCMAHFHAASPDSKSYLSQKKKKLPFSMKPVYNHTLPFSLAQRWLHLQPSTLLPLECELLEGWTR